MDRYSVIIVGRNRPKQILAALLSLRQRGQPTEVLVVDNASDKSMAGVAALSQLPVQVLRLQEHRSLGAAFNAGLDAASHSAVLLMHCDTILEADPSIGMHVLEREPEVGIVGGKLLSPGDSPRRIRHAGYALGRGRVGPKARARGDWDGLRQPEEVDAVSDACMFVRRTDLRFDERFWFRLQDVDFCLQYRQRGMQVRFVPDMRASHSEAGGVSELAGSFEWSSRQLASQVLYHERWCSDLSLERHPLHFAVRDEQAIQYLHGVDVRYGRASICA